MELDIFGQQPGLSNLYTQISSVYRVADPASHQNIVDSLVHGLEKLSEGFPWVAGQVINDISGEGHHGNFKIVPYEKIPRLIVKDLRTMARIPSLDILEAAHYPSRMLDESDFAPRGTLPGTSDDSTSPVFLVQITFITGAVILTFVAQHNVMDMTGQGHIIDLLSKACYDYKFTSAELEDGNASRTAIIPQLDSSYTAGPELSNQLVKDHVAVPTPHSKCSWAYFVFRPEALSELKKTASGSAPSTTKYISTDDALSAFIWQSVIRARLPRLQPDLQVTFARAIDPRRHLGISPTYPGVVQNMTYTTNTISELIDVPLGHIAAQLRMAVDVESSDVAYRTRALATVIARTPDRSRISPTASLNLSADIMLSSWSKQDFYNLEFNLGLGKPVAVRRPQFTPVESLMYLMPKALDGEIAVGLCLRDEDMTRLREDALFGRYATYAG